MKLFGRAYRRYGKRLLIARCDPAGLPRLYGDVLDRRMRSLGMVIEIFGNVEAPYALILLRGDRRPAAGESLFARTRERKDGRGREDKAAPDRA